MADRTDFYFRQRVTEAELDLAFEQLERADRDLAADIGVRGIISGAVPAPHVPVADLTIDLTAPARAYDRLGQRIFFGTGQRVDCSVDHAGLPTEVPTPGEERWLGVFLRFERALSDPRTDGNSREVFFRRDQSFELVVRQGPAILTLRGWDQSERFELAWARLAATYHREVHVLANVVELAPNVRR